MNNNIHMCDSFYMKFSLYIFISIRVDLSVYASVCWNYTSAFDISPLLSAHSPILLVLSGWYSYLFLSLTYVFLCLAKCRRPEMIGHIQQHCNSSCCKLMTANLWITTIHLASLAKKNETNHRYE